MMRTMSLALLSALVLAACTGSGTSRSSLDTANLAAREARLNMAKLSPDSVGSDEPLALWVMPQNLAEISGLALLPNGRLLTHPDEQGIVSVIDYRRGVVIKQFVLGRKGVQADFEGIAVVDQSIFMMTSNGKLYEFQEGANKASVDFTIRDTELGKECEFEGLTYDASLNSLILACKNVGEKKLKDHLVLYRWQLGEGVGERLSRVEFSLENLFDNRDWKDLSPTSIDVDPHTGNYVMTTNEKLLVVATKEGVVLEARQLPDRHAQPEGLVITPDSLLIISDEAVTRPAFITVYRWPWR